MRKQQTHRWWLGLVGLVLAACIGASGWSYWRNHAYAGQRYTETNVQTLATKGRYNLVFYRPGCAYCHGAKPAIIAASHRSAIPTAFINVRSEVGQGLVNRYHVTKAATVVTIRPGKEPQLYVYAKHAHVSYFAIISVLKDVFNE